MKRICFCVLVFILILFPKESVVGATTEEMLKELDFSDITAFLEEKEEIPVTFEEVIRAILGQGEVSYERIGTYLKDVIGRGIKEHQGLLIRLLMISLAFSILKNYGKDFFHSYISEITFFLCYCFMMILLLKSFSSMNESVIRTTETMVSFMKVLLPTYCAAISLSLNLHTSGAVYSMIFFGIYLVEWLIHYLLVPLVQIYIMMEFLNHLMEEERFKRLSEFIENTVKVLLKVATSFVLGMNLIQGMIAPAMDRLTGNTVAKTIQMLPGIGNVVNGMGQIFITSGLLIKNCIGVAAVVMLFLLCAIPFLKMAVLAVLYKFLSAVLEPIADKRLSGGVNGVANAGMLYLKILTTCFMLFFLTIALSCAATGLGGG